MLEVRIGDVGGVLQRPRGSEALFVLAHGAGAGMRHPFLESLAGALEERSIATLRFQFPYLEAGRKRPDPPQRLQSTILDAVAEGVGLAKGLPVLLGGKSLGGRMASLLQAEDPVEGVRALVFVGFPLHAPGKPGSERGKHLAKIDVPMLFLQGTRDRLADLGLLRPLLQPLGRKARLHVVEHADHSFHVPKRSGRTDDEVVGELADTIAAFADGL